MKMFVPVYVWLTSIARDFTLDCERAFYSVVET